MVENLRDHGCMVYATMVVIVYSTMVGLVPVGNFQWRTEECAATFT